MCPSAPLSQPQAVDNQADVDQLEDTDDIKVDQQPILQSPEEGENNCSSNKSPVLCRNLRPVISRWEAKDLIDSASSSSRSENTFMASWNSEEYFDRDALLRDLETPAATDDSPECFDAGALLRDLETPAATDDNPECFDAGALLRDLETPAPMDTNPECFDAGALLRNLETPAPMDTNLRNVDYMLNVDASQGSCQLLIQPLASDSIGSCSNEMPNTYVEETADSATMMSMQRKQDLNPTHSTAVVEERSDGMPSERGTAAHEVSQGPSTSQDSKVNGKRKATVSRIAKFKKKFLGFMQLKFFCFFKLEKKNLLFHTFLAARKEKKKKKVLF